jgi:hypothetical protein
MQGMAMNPAAFAQMAAAQSGQLPKANSAQLQQQLVAGGAAAGSMAMPAVSAPATAVPGMQSKMGTPVRPANMQTMVAGAMPGWYHAPTAVQSKLTGIHATRANSRFALHCRWVDIPVIVRLLRVVLTCCAFLCLQEP